MKRCDTLVRCCASNKQPDLPINRFPVEPRVGPRGKSISIFWTAALLNPKMLGRALLGPFKNASPSAHIRTFRAQPLLNTKASRAERRSVSSAFLHPLSLPSIKKSRFSFGKTHVRWYSRNISKENTSEVTYTPEGAQVLAQILLILSRPNPSLFLQISTK